MLKRLKPNDVIAFYSPSAPATVTAPKRFERAKSFLEGKGFRLLPGALTGKSDVYRSGSVRERADELNGLIRNPEVKCIISTIGGLNSNALVPYIDYNAFLKAPKIMVGHSDVSVILAAIYAKTGIHTFFGPALIPSFGEFPPFAEMTYHHFRDILIERQSMPFVYDPPEFWTDEFANWEEKTKEKERRENRWITVTEGKTSGRVIGGTLNALAGIWGSEYMPEIREGDILFVEDTSKTASYLEKLYGLLKTNGVFDRISGIIMGKHERYDDQGSNRKPHDILLEVSENTAIPFLAEFDCGHTHPMFTLPIGATVELDAANKRVAIVDPWIG